MINMTYYINRHLVILIKTTSLFLLHTVLYKQINIITKIISNYNEIFH